MSTCAQPAAHDGACRCDVSGVVVTGDGSHFAGQPEGPLWVASFGLGIVFTRGEICVGDTGLALGHRYALIHAGDEEQARLTADILLGHGNWASLAPERPGMRSVLRFGKEPLFRGPAGVPAVLTLASFRRVEVLS